MCFPSIDSIFSFQMSEAQKENGCKIDQNNTSHVLVAASLQESKILQSLQGQATKQDTTILSKGMQASSKICMDTPNVGQFIVTTSTKEIEESWKKQNFY